MTAVIRGDTQLNCSRGDIIVGNHKSSQVFYVAPVYKSHKQTGSSWNRRLYYFWDLQQLLSGLWFDQLFLCLPQRACYRVSAVQKLKHAVRTFWILGHYCKESWFWKMYSWQRGKGRSFHSENILNY